MTPPEHADDDTHAADTRPLRLPEVAESDEDDEYEPFSSPLKSRARPRRKVNP